MNETIQHRTLALGGLYQSADLVSSLAWEGQVEPIAYRASILSLFETDAASYAAVFGGIAGVATGLKVLKAQLLRKSGPRDVEKTRYAIMLLFLQKRLEKNPELTETLKAGLERGKRQLAHFEPTHGNVIELLADLYQRTISPLGPKIIVRGNPVHLTHPQTASRIRALLLAGIRAAVLWRQAGGNRWRLVLERRVLLRETTALLETDV